MATEGLRQRHGGGTTEAEGKVHALGPVEHSVTQQAVRMVLFAVYFFGTSFLSVQQQCF